MEHWVTQLNEAGVPAGPVYSVPQVVEDPQVKHLNVVSTLPNVHHKDMHYISQPMQLSRTPAQVATPAPGWGGRSDVVLAEIGFTPEQIKAFHDSGAV